MMIKQFLFSDEKNAKYLNNLLTTHMSNRI